MCPSLTIGSTESFCLSVRVSARVSLVQAGSKKISKDTTVEALKFGYTGSLSHGVIHTTKTLFSSKPPARIHIQSIWQKCINEKSKIDWTP